MLSCMLLQSHLPSSSSNEHHIVNFYAQHHYFIVNTIPSLSRDFQTYLDLLTIMMIFKLHYYLAPLCYFFFHPHQIASVAAATTVLRRPTTTTATHERAATASETPTSSWRYPDIGKNDHNIKLFQQRSKEQRQLSDKWITENSLAPHSVANCPCDDPKWCEPIRTTTITIKTQSSPRLKVETTDNRNHGFVTTTTTPTQESEVYGFAGSKSTGEYYNWTHITTVAWASNNDMMCRAHQHGARVILASPSFNLTEIAYSPSQAERNRIVQDWVQQTLHMVRTKHADGIVFDYEEPVPYPNSPEIQAYVTLISATHAQFQKVIPPLQVSTCVAWSPDGIDGRHYPIQQLANASDLLYVMDYDTQSQITQGPCIANANAPFASMKVGLGRYLDILRRQGDSKKIVLGVPWYGYRYPCLDGTQPNDKFCPIQHVPFRGINCSDAAGSEIPYSLILQTYYNMTMEERTRTGGIRRDDYQDASYLNTIVVTKDVNANSSSSSLLLEEKAVTTRRRTKSSIRTNDESTAVYQYWFDDPQGLRHKYAYAKSLSLGGVGPFTFDDLDPVTQPNESKDIWSAFDAFTRTTIRNH